MAISGFAQSTILFDSNYITPVYGDSYESACQSEILMAQQDLQKLNKPIYAYCDDRTDSAFRSTIYKVCLKRGIVPKRRYCIKLCGNDPFPNGYCYDEFVTKDLMHRKGDSIINILHKEAILTHIKLKPDFLLQTASFYGSDSPGFNYPKVYLEQWRPQHYHSRDTLYLDKKEHPIKKFYKYSGTDSVTKEYPLGIHVDLKISSRGELKIQIDREQEKEILDFVGFEKNSTELIALTEKFVVQKYHKWKPATFYGRPVYSIVRLFVVLSN